MAVRGWATSITTAVGAAAAAAAGQLGLGYGLGVVAWQPSTDQAGERLWLTSLTWTLWVAASSAVVGAVVAARLDRRRPDTALHGSTVEATGSAVEATASTVDRPVLAEVAWRILVAVSSGVGALVTVPLVAVPARAAVHADTYAPNVTAAGYALLGVVLGTLAAVAAVSSRAVAANLVGSAGWLWLLAVAAVADGLRSGRGPGTAQLATWDFAAGGYFRGIIYLPGALLMLGGALVIGAAAAWLPGRRGEYRIGVAVSGVASPLLVAAAYFLAAPSLVGVDLANFSAYLVAPYGVIAGLAGSVLAAAVGPALAGRTAVREPVDEQTLREWSRTLAPEPTPSTVVEVPPAAPTVSTADTALPGADEDLPLRRTA